MSNSFLTKYFGILRCIIIMLSIRFAIVFEFVVPFIAHFMP